MRDGIPRSPNGKFDRHCSAGVRLVSIRANHGRGVRRKSTASSPSAAVPLDLLAERVGSTPFFAYDRALLTDRVELLQATAAGASI